MISKMILSLVMVIVIMITGTDSSLIGKVRLIDGIDETDGIGETEEVSKKIEDKKQINFGGSMIQFVSNNQTRELSFLAVKKAAITPETNKSIKYTTADVSAYTSGYESTGKTLGDPAYGITASGKRVKENHTIACPESLRFGTRIYVPKLRKTYTCEDRGSLITEGKLDIYIADLKQARKFGRQQLEVQILSRDEPI